MTFIAFVTGAALGYAVWSWNSPLALLLFLPLLYGAGRPWTAALLMFGYFLGSYTTEPDAYQGQFGWSLLAAWSITLLHAAIMTAPYAAGAYLAKDRAWGKGLAWAIALILVSVPPLGSIGVLTPLFVAADLCPGCGNAGLVLTVIVTGFMAVAAHALRRSNIRNRVLIAAGMGAATLWIALLTPGNAGETATQKGWIGLDTCIPGGDWTLQQAQKYQAHIQQRIEAASKAGHKIVVLPENIAGEWKHTRYLWDQTREFAQQNRMTILLGAATGSMDQSWQNAVIQLGRDMDSDKKHLALQPVPFGSWKPWSKNSAQAFWMTKPDTLVINGQYTALSLCYENVILWPMAWRSLQWKPDMLVALINHAWEPKGSRLHEVQRKAIEAQAKIWGVGLVSSRNMPSAACSING